MFIHHLLTVRFCKKKNSTYSTFKHCNSPDLTFNLFPARAYKHKLQACKRSARRSDHSAAALRSALQMYLIVSPAGLPHAQRLRVRKLALETEKNPAVTEQQLKSVLTQPSQMLVKAWQHQS